MKEATKNPLLTVIVGKSKKDDPNAGNPCVNVQLAFDTNKGKVIASSYIVSGKTRNKGAFLVGDTLHIYSVEVRESEEAKAMAETASLHKQLADLQAQLAKLQTQTK